MTTIIWKVLGGYDFSIDGIGTVPSEGTLTVAAGTYVLRFKDILGTEHSISQLAGPPFVEVGGTVYCLSSSDTAGTGTAMTAPTIGYPVAWKEWTIDAAGTKVKRKESSNAFCAFTVGPTADPIFCSTSASSKSATAQTVGVAGFAYQNMRDAAGATTWTRYPAGDATSCAAVPDVVGALYCLAASDIAGTGAAMTTATTGYPNAWREYTRANSTKYKLREAASDASFCTVVAAPVWTNPFCATEAGVSSWMGHLPMGHLNGSSTAQSYPDYQSHCGTWVVDTGACASSGVYWQDFRSPDTTVNGTTVAGTVGTAPRYLVGDPLNTCPPPAGTFTEVVPTVRECLNTSTTYSAGAVGMTSAHIYTWRKWQQAGTSVTEFRYTQSDTTCGNNGDPTVFTPILDPNSSLMCSTSASSYSGAISSGDVSHPYAWVRWKISGEATGYQTEYRRDASDDGTCYTVPVVITGQGWQAGTETCRNNTNSGPGDVQWMDWKDSAGSIDHIQTGQLPGAAANTRPAGCPPWYPVGWSGVDDCRFDNVSHFGEQWGMYAATAGTAAPVYTLQWAAGAGAVAADGKPANKCSFTKITTFVGNIATSNYCAAYGYSELQKHDYNYTVKRSGTTVHTEMITEDAQSISNGVCGLGFWNGGSDVLSHCADSLGRQSGEAGFVAGTAIYVWRNCWRPANATPTDGQDYVTPFQPFDESTYTKGLVPSLACPAGTAAAYMVDTFSDFALDSYSSDVELSGLDLGGSESEGDSDS